MVLRLTDLFGTSKTKSRKKIEEYIGNTHIIRVPRLRRMSLRVKPTGEALVRAPMRVSLGEIRRFLAEHESWIDKQRKNHAKLVPLSRERLLYLRAEAKKFLPERVRALALKHGFQYKSVSFRHQKSRWGSCSHRNTLSLNIELMRLPLELCDYIILHELTHTIHKHHQDAFWNHLERVLPGSLILDKRMREWKIGYE